MKIIILILTFICPITLFGDEVSECVKISLKLESQGGEIISFLNIINLTNEEFYISESGVGLIDFRNLLNQYIVLDKHGVELNYDGILDHSSNLVHKIPVGKNLKIEHRLTSVYNFE